MEATVTHPAHTSGKGVHYAVWAVQILLALLFFAGGLMKLVTPIDDLFAQGMAYTHRMPAALVRFIGTAEVLGAVGLVLPSALRILPWLTPLAAGGLVTIMVLAAGEHTMNGELFAVPVNATLGALAAFVVWGRAVKAPITAR